MGQVLYLDYFFTKVSVSDTTRARSDSKPVVSSAADAINISSRVRAEFSRLRHPITERLGQSENSRGDRFLVYPLFN